MLKASKLKINGIYTDVFDIHPQGRVEMPTAEQDTEYIDIRGRNGLLTKKYGYKDIILSVVFNMHDKDSFKAVFRKAKMNLFNAKTLTFDDDSEVYYKVKNVQIDIAENVVILFGEFTVNFTLDPFQYEIENNPITITSSQTITNDGYETLPIITATVAGTGKIYIGDQVVTIKDVNGTITIDSEVQNAYRGNQNLNKHMIGKFPVLESGNNTVSFDGDISKLEIICNRRWV